MISTIILAIQYVAIAIMLIEMIYAMMQKPSDMQKYVIILAISTMLMFIGYIIEIQAGNLETGLIGCGVAYIGKPYVMLASFLLLCSYYGVHVNKYVTIITTLWCAIFPIIVFSNEHHYLYYTNLTYNPAGDYTPLSMGRGPLYYLYVATMVVYFVACILVILRGYKKSKNKNKGILAIYSILMIVCGISGYAAYLAGLTNGYDSTMLGVLGGSICLFIIFIKCKIFDALTLAKDYALDDSSVGLLVFDSDDRIVYQNDVMKKIVSDVPLNMLKTLTKTSVTFGTGDKTYSILKKDLVAGGNMLGKSFEISDITESYNYQVALEKNVKERTAKIEAIQRKIIGSVASIVEARSVETGEHIVRTSEYAGMVAEKLVEMGEYKDTLTKDYVSNLVSATPLHDIGKIAVSDTILLKPGRLTDEEFEKMKVHTTEGLSIIDNSMKGLESDDYIKMAEDIAYYHHERWDGKGYPTGISGEDIPLSARIVAIADVYDALVSERCYKKPVPKEDAIRIIIEESGTHFDPKVAEAFVSALSSKA